MSDDNQDNEGIQMSFLDHLDELRQRLIRSVISIVLAFGVCFTFSEPIYRFLSVPVIKQLQKERRNLQASYGSINVDEIAEGELIQYTFTRETAVNGVKIPLGTTIPVRKLTIEGQPRLVLAERWSVAKTILPVNTPIEQIQREGESKIFFDDESNQLVLRGVTSPFMVYVRVALYAGIALAIPFLFFQLWAFVSPGLYQHEKKYIVPVILMSTFFFVAGASFAYLIAFPAVCDYMLGLAMEGGFRTLLDAEDYLDLIIMIMLGLGIVFQIPTISFVLGRIGLLTARMMLKAWRYAIIGIMIVAAVATPTPDAFNMLMFAAPMGLLYLLSIVIVWLFGKKRQTDDEYRLEHGA